MFEVISFYVLYCSLHGPPVFPSWSVCFKNVFGAFLWVTGFLWQNIGRVPRVPPSTWATENSVQHKSSEYGARGRENIFPTINPMKVATALPAAILLCGDCPLYVVRRWRNYLPGAQIRCAQSLENPNGNHKIDTVSTFETVICSAIFHRSAVRALLFRFP